MRIKSDYILTQVAGESVVVAAGAASQNLNGLIRLNPTAACIWECLQTDVDEATIVNRVSDVFAVEDDIAARDVREFLGILTEGDILE